MPTCRTCGQYYTRHAMLCPVCHPVDRATALPSIGDTWIDDAGQSTITGLTIRGTLITLDLADGSQVDIERPDLRPAAAPVQFVELVRQASITQASTAPR